MSRKSRGPGPRSGLPAGYKYCPDCGEVHFAGVNGAHAASHAGGGVGGLVGAGASVGMRQGPFGPAINGAPLLRRAAAAVKRQRLMGGTIKQERPPGAEGAKLVEGYCPRCKRRFWTFPRYGLDLCKCGWLLKIEPLMGGLSVDDAVQVFDPTGASGSRDEAKERVRLAVGVRRIFRNWESRGAKFKGSLEDGHRVVELHFANGQVMRWSEAEERGRQGGA